MFFGESPKPPNPFKEIDLSNSKKLLEAVRKRWKIARPVQIAGWASSFQKLRKLDQIKKKRIARVLEWYCAHIGIQFIPLAASGKSFRAKFLQIEMAMEKDEKQNPNLPISPMAQRICQKLSKFHWPKDSRSQIPQAVEQSLMFLRKFNKLRAEAPEKFAKNGNISQSVIMFAGRMEIKGIQLEDFIYRHFETVFYSVVDWADWSGNLMAKAFGDRQLKGLGREWSGAYSGNPEIWDKYYKVLTGD